MKSRRTVERIGLGLAVSLASLACSGGNLGKTGTGGTGGGGPSTTLDLPGCLRDLLAPCTPEAACVTEPGGQSCFASGVRASLGSTRTPGDCPNGTNTADVNKPDGTLCYRFESSIDPNDASCSVFSYKWKDAAGNLVASGAWSSTKPDRILSISCTASGEQAACQPTQMPTPAGNCCSLSVFGDSFCTGGVVTPPCVPGGCVGGPGGTPFGPDLHLPDCVKNLVAPCDTVGACMAEVNAAGDLSQLCFDSGVRASFSGVDASTGAGVARLSKADGSSCFSFEATDVGGGALAYTWKDAAGQVVATGRNDPLGVPTIAITCAGGGETATCYNPPSSPMSFCCGVSGLGNSTCDGAVACDVGTCR
jgi:hypothetical protein